MEVKAQLRYLRIAPRKVRLVADQLRGETVAKSKSFLNFTVKGANQPLTKLLNSAIANAKNNFDLEESNLYVSEIRVDEGPKIKRWMPRARGSASPIQKKTSHITITLKEIKESDKKVAKKKDKVEVTSVASPEEVKNLDNRKKRKEESFNNKPKRDLSDKKLFRRKSI